MITNEQINQLLRFIEESDQVEVDDFYAQSVHTYQNDLEDNNVALCLIHTDHETGEIYEFEFTRRELRKAQVNGNEIAVQDTLGNSPTIYLYERVDHNVPHELALAFEEEEEA